MTFRILLCIFLLSSLKSQAQEETDSLFYFDFGMDWTSAEDAKWISRKTELYDSVYLVETTRKDTSRYLNKRTLDRYTIVSDKKMLIDRSFSKKGRSLPGRYEIEVDIVTRQLGLYELDLYSKELNIHRRVYSNTLVPICPILKTIEYHPNCTMASISFHGKEKGSRWNSDGGLISKLYYFTDDVDELPVIEGYETYSFDLAMKRNIQEVLDYTNEARNAEIEGRVYTSFTVTSTGKVENIRVTIGVHPLIDNSALDALRSIKIARPAMKDGKFVDLVFRWPFSFHIQ